jgi:hypothetical protein
VLVVGVHSDEEIIAHKGIPVMKYEERIAMVSACKWVDEIVLDAPYLTMLSVMDQNKIDYCVHGEDISTTADGSDSFSEVKNAGRFKFVAFSSFSSPPLSLIFHPSFHHGNLRMLHMISIFSTINTSSHPQILIRFLRNNSG